MRTFYYGHAALNQRKRPTRSVIQKVLTICKPEWGLLSLGILALVVSSAVNLYVPISVGLLIDSSSDAELHSRAIILLFVFSAGAFATFLRGWLFALAGEKTSARVRRNVVAAILAQDMSYFDEHETGSLTNYVSVDINLLKAATSFHFPMMIRFGVQVVGGVAILLYLSWKLALVMSSVFPVMGVVAVIYGMFVRRLSQSNQAALATSNASAEEAISSVRFSKSFNLENLANARFASTVGNTYLWGRKMSMAMALFQGGAEWLAYLSIVLVFWYGALLLRNGELSEGALVSFVLYAVLIAHAMGALSHQTGDFMRGVGGCQEMINLLSDSGDAASSLTSVAAHPLKVLDHVEGNIEFSDVSFSYPSRPHVCVLDNFSISISKGEVVAFVGTSGGGKSTVFQLLSGLYKPTAGRITIDGVDLSALDTAQLRSQLGMVNQDTVLLSGTIADNIACAVGGTSDRVVSEDEIIAAAKIAQLHDFVMTLPEKYKTVVGPRGVQLSGGQRQRISIARLILRNPAVLLLDEATSALDAESEHAFQEALEKIVQGRTVLMIAHRLSTVQIAHRVVVMDHGRIVEQGTHEELMKLSSGVYRHLVDRQSIASSPTHVQAMLT
jgi:ATP-binding cassette subfamily B protein